MNLANLTHLHLLLNHFPTVGFLIGLGLFLAAIVGKSENLKRASLVIFFLIALLAIPTYLSGKAAQQAITGRPDVPEALILASGTLELDRGLPSFDYHVRPHGKNCDHGW